ncbi:MAG: molybdate ABC transporter substrate-binding protein [Pseudomonadales bacterium]|nr:molybdate ABC transporter substrate-binding protein [Pseudomonadales bacterium]
MAAKSLRLGLLCFVLTSYSVFAAPGEASNDNKVTVAVASNFLSTMKQLVDTYESDTGRVVRLSGGSTGKHYAQISQGAPFDLFFAADEVRPALLEAKDIGVKGSRFTYAEGLLVVWSPEISNINESNAASFGKNGLKALLGNQRIKTLAMANPKLAPYGKAAQDVVNILLPVGLNSKDDRKLRVIRGENISQTLQFVMSGTADLAFLARSQVLDQRLLKVQKERYKMIFDHYRLIPETLYQPIKQEAIMLNDKELTQLFVNFIKGPIATSIIKSNGYRVVGSADAG